MIDQAQSADDHVVIREATPQDAPVMMDVRTSVRENLLTREQLVGLGITDEFVAEMLRSSHVGWCAEVDGAVVGCSMVERATGTVFALFVRPEAEGDGVGSTVLDATVNWMRENRYQRAVLTTGYETRAYDFYLRQGWKHAGTADNGEAIFELRLAGEEA